MNRLRLYTVSFVVVLLSGILGTLLGPAARGKLEQSRLERAADRIQACANTKDTYGVILRAAPYSSPLGNPAVSLTVALLISSDAQLDSAFVALFQCARNEPFAVYAFQFVTVSRTTVKFVDRTEAGLVLQLRVTNVIRRSALESLVEEDKPFMTMLAMGAADAGVWILPVAFMKVYLQMPDGIDPKAYEFMVDRAREIVGAQ